MGSYEGYIGETCQGYDPRGASQEALSLGSRFRV